MTGYYFINTDLRNTRAHTSQVLHTAAALGGALTLTLICPRYPGLDIERIAQRHALPRVPKLAMVWNFGLRNAGFLSFVLFNIPAIFFLISKKIAGEVDFVYVRASYFLPLVCIAWFLGVPIFFETHRRPISPGERLREGLVARMATGLVVVSAHVRQYFAHLHTPLLVSHDAVALERFGEPIEKQEARSRLGVAPSARIAVYAGSVSLLKGLDTLFAAARLLPQVRFLCAGRVVGDAGEPPVNVELLGQREQSELPALLRAADVLLLPHPHNDYSQSPMKLFEYMASGVPLVSSRLPSLTEVLTEQNAVLVEPSNAQALAQGISRALADPAAAARLAAQALHDVGEHTWEARGKKIATFVQATIHHD